MIGKVELVLSLGAITGLLACASAGRRVEMVYPQKTTYLDAEALDGGEISVPPRLEVMVHPAYPAAGAGRPGEAWAIVVFQIDGHGRIEKVRVESVSEPILEGPAVDAIREWKLEPAKRDGVGIPVRATVKLTFDPA